MTAALLTGCRYGELTAFRSSDFDPQAGTIHVRLSKSGRGRHVALTNEGEAFFKARAEGKAAADLLLTRDLLVKQATKTEVARFKRGAWGASHQFRPIRAACASAGIEPAVSFHILRHTYASRLAMRGAPMAVIAAQLGHSDTRMTERHYAHLGPRYIADTVRKTFGSLGLK